jgi:uncharacterized protein (TIGR03437 family)
MYKLRRGLWCALLLAAGLLLNLWAQNAPHDTEQACQFTLAPLNQSFSAVGGAGNFSITTSAANCEWTVRSNAPWLSITSATRGTGNATVNFTVAPSVGARSGTISVNGRAFTVWQSVNACSEARFALPQPMAQALGLTHYVAKDFNNDGNVDLLTLGYGISAGLQLTFNAGKGDGSFGAAVSFAPEFILRSLPRLDAGDFNNDGKFDLVIMELETVYIRLGDGAGRFGAVTSFPITNGALEMTLGDFNNDRNLDVITANDTGAALSVLLGEGTGKLKPEVKLSLTEVPSGVVALAAGDFNGDAKLDLLYLPRGAYFFVLLPGTGAGGFGRGANVSFVDRTVTTAVSPNGVAMGDLNGDGKLDVAVSSNQGTWLVSNKGDGTFNEAQKLSGSSSKVLIGDVNGDGAADVLTIEGLVTLWRNLGGGRFAEPVDYLVGRDGPNIFGPTLADINRDGLPDVVLPAYVIKGPLPLVGISIVLGNRLSGLALPAGQPVDFFPNGSALADLNGDGLQDLLTIYHLDNNSGALRVSFGNGAGNFTALVNTYAARNPVRLEVRDLNLDGKPDVIVADEGSGLLDVWLNDGSGRLTQGQQVAYRRGAPGFVVADFDNDGRPDLLLNTPGEATASVLLGNGNGSFNLAALKVTAYSNDLFVTGDFNGDGNLDAAAWRQDTIERGFIIIYHGNGRGNLTEALTINLPSYPHSVVSGDLNGDGRDDLALSYVHPYPERVGAVLLNKPEGGFANPVNYPMMEQSRLQLADLNGDARLDLITTPTVFPDNSLLFINKGNGAFSDSLLIPNIAALGDVNDDGLPDLLVFVQRGVNKAQFFKVTNNSRCLSPNAALTVSAASFLGSKVASESIVALFGANLATETRAAPSVPLPTDLAGTSVRVKDSAGTERAAPLFFVSASQINWQLPAGLSNGVALVNVVRNGNTITTGTVQISSVAPAIFAANAAGTGFPAGIVLRIKSDGSQVFEPVAQFNAALNRFVGVAIDLSNPTEQVFLILFGTGWRNRSALANVTARIGGLAAEVTYAGRQGSLVGLDQANLRLPRGLSGSGEVDLTLTADGKASNAVRISIK